MIQRKKIKEIIKKMSSKQLVLFFAYLLLKAISKYSEILSKRCEIAASVLKRVMQS